MKTSFANKKCEHCQKEYDPVKEKCPHCGQSNEAFSRKLWPMNAPAPVMKQGILFVVGCIGFRILAVIINLLAAGSLDAESIPFKAVVNYTTYGLIFVILSLIVFSYWKTILKIFKNKKTYFGIIVGLVLVLFNIGYTKILEAAGIGSNANQEALDQVVQNYKVLGFIVFGLLGPLTEELTYRLGLFDLLKRAHIAIAYVVTAIIFALIHFDFGNIGSATEWINLPNYLICGAVLCFANDRFGIGASMIAHVINNMSALILMVI